MVPMVRTGYCRANIQIELDLGWVHANRRDDPGRYCRVVMVRSGFISNLVMVRSGFISNLFFIRILFGIDICM